MTDDDDLDGLAAEYALGTLSLAERREVEARRTREAALDQAVKAWERRLGPLGERTPEIAPPADLYPRIADRLWGAGRTPGATVIPMPGARRASAWSASRVAALSMAACLLLGIAWVVLLSGPGAPTLLVAELHRSPGSAADEGAGAKGAPAFKITLDLKERSMVVSPVSLRPTPRRSFEL
jgi:anti-sigma-K factor RskA